MRIRLVVEALASFRPSLTVVPRGNCGGCRMIQCEFSLVDEMIPNVAEQCSREHLFWRK